MNNEQGLRSGRVGVGVGVLPVLNSMLRLGLVDTLVTDANIKGFGL